MKSEARTILDTSITEAAFQRQLTDLLDHLGVLWYHPNDSRRDNPGFPDLTFVAPIHHDLDRQGPCGTALYTVELKTEKGRLRPKQREWQEALGRAEMLYPAVWRPSDMDWIVGLLTGEYDWNDSGGDGRQ